MISSGSKKFIAEQNRLLGPALDGLAQDIPDIGHVLKNAVMACMASRKRTLRFQERTYSRTPESRHSLLMSAHL